MSLRLDYLMMIIKSAIFVDHGQTLDALEAYCEQMFKGHPPLKLNVYMKVDCGYG